VTKKNSDKGVHKNSFSFSLVTENKVLKYLNKLSSNKATGLDGIPARFVVDSASLIACPFTHVINLSLIQGTVPARVVPLYKKGDKTVGNYRPVSILSVISKIFERVVYDQVDTYPKEKKILYDFQFGFRSSYFTDTCLIHLTDFIRFQFDKCILVGMVFPKALSLFEQLFNLYY